MPVVSFTRALERFLTTPRLEVEAATLGDALAAVFATHPALRGYVLDDQGHLRPNVVVFIDGRRSSERVRLADPLRADSEVHVLQALSGG